MSVAPTVSSGLLRLVVAEGQVVGDGGQQLMHLPGWRSLARQPSLSQLHRYGCSYASGTQHGIGQGPESLYQPGQSSTQPFGVKPSASGRTAVRIDIEVFTSPLSP